MINLENNINSNLIHYYFMKILTKYECVNQDIYSVLIIAILTDNQ